MPTSSLNPLKWKKFRLFAIFLLSPLFFYGQSLTGLWIGTLSNDSTTIRKDQSFEIALTEYKGKVYGYSRSEFIVNDTVYFIVKRVKGTINGDICEVVDDEIVSYNFLGKLDKGIKVTSTFKRNKSDSTWYLAGTWKTNAAKKYYAITGKLNLDQENDLTASKIFPHLEELNLAKDVAFYKERVEGSPIVKLAKPEKQRNEYFAANFNERTNISQPVITIKEPQRAELKSQEPVSSITDEQKIVPVTSDAESSSLAELKSIDKPSDLPKTKTNETKLSSVSIKPVDGNKTLAKNQVAEIKEEEKTIPVTKPAADLPKTDIHAVSVSKVSVRPADVKKSQAKSQVRNNQQIEKIVDDLELPKTTTVTSKPDNKVQAVKTEDAKVVATDKKPITNNPTTIAEKTVEKPIVNTPVLAPEIKMPSIDVTALASSIAGRKSEFSQMVSFRSDSLELTLYDNGEVDGDTVSIFMNGEVILSKQGLKASAIKKTIYIKPGNEEFTLVLFAENLGRYPPNTGLLVVHDGEDVYNLRFSSDYQKNAGIIFKRKH